MEKQDIGQENERQGKENTGCGEEKDIGTARRELSAGYGFTGEELDDILGEAYGERHGGYGEAVRLAREYRKFRDRETALCGVGRMMDRISGENPGAPETAEEISERIMSEETAKARKEAAETGKEYGKFLRDGICRKYGLTEEEADAFIGLSYRNRPRNGYGRTV